jgi:ATP-dependent RNA helicase DHX37/DHR1
MEGPNKRPRHHVGFTIHEHEDSESESMDEGDFLEKADPIPVQYEHTRSVAEVVTDPPTESTVSQAASLSTFAIGGALKRNTDGSVVAPLVVNSKSEKHRKVC